MQWEYMVVRTSPEGDHQSQLNKLGSKGWEVVAVSVQFTDHFVWLKRPAPAAA